MLEHADKQRRRFNTAGLAGLAALPVLAADGEGSGAPLPKPELQGPASLDQLPLLSTLSVPGVAVALLDTPASAHARAGAALLPPAAARCLHMPGTPPRLHPFGLPPQSPSSTTPPSAHAEIERLLEEAAKPPAIAAITAGSDGGSGSGSEGEGGEGDAAELGSTLADDSDLDLGSGDGLDDWPPAALPLPAPAVDQDPLGSLVRQQQEARLLLRLPDQRDSEVPPAYEATPRALVSSLSALPLGPPGSCRLLDSSSSIDSLLLTPLLSPHPLTRRPRTAASTPCCAPRCWARAQRSPCCACKACMAAPCRPASASRSWRASWRPGRAAPLWRSWPGSCG